MAGLLKVVCDWVTWLIHPEVLSSPAPPKPLSASPPQKPLDALPHSSEVLARPPEPLRPPSPPPQTKGRYMAQVRYKMLSLTRYRIVVIIALRTKLEWVKKKYGKEWRLFLEFPMQFDRNHNSIQMEISPIKSEKDDGDKWEVFPVLPDDNAVTKEDVEDAFMSEVPPWIPCQIFMAKFVSPTKRRPAELELEITLNGSRPSTVIFSVDVDSQDTSRTMQRDSVEDECPECSQVDFLDDVAAKIPSKWRIFGLYLGIDFGRLDAVETKNHFDPDLCFGQVYSIWKKERCIPVTWATVVKILENNMLKENSLAQKIRTKYHV